MTQPYIVAVEGLSAIRSYEEIPQAVLRAARAAVNKTVDHARAVSSREIRDQVNFPARYLTETDGSGNPRLGVTQRARNKSLSAVLAARRRPTSLARFVVGGTNPKTTKRQGGVRVSVKPGSSKVIPRAFLFQLRGGNAGLAIRTDGERPSGAWKPLPIGKNLFLLYGPSVDQVFGGPRGVAEGVAPNMAEHLELEFTRLLKVDLRG